jgi:hypothetical protein
MVKPQLTLTELKRRWEAIRKDDCGASALKSIKRAGWDLEAIDVDRNTWPGIIAAIPSLPNRRAGSTPYPAPREAARRVMLWLRGLAGAAEDGCRIETRDIRQRVIYMNGAHEIDPARLRSVANAIEDLALHKRWVVTRHNSQQNAIAELRWTVRHRCGKPMDSALLSLLDAAFRAAGEKGVRLDQDALKKVENTECKTRMKARQKLRN